MASDKNIVKQRSRMRRARRVRGKIRGTLDCPRLVVFKSLNHIYAQLVDDTARKTLAGVSSLKGSLDASGTKMDKAKAVGEAIAQKAQELGIQRIVFDRSCYLYHGNVKMLAEAARKAGLKF